MNTNPVTQKQIDYINILKQQDAKTGFLYGTVATYERMETRGRLPDAIYGDDIIIGDFSINDRVIIPTSGSLTPADVMEMKKSFDNYIANYTPETTLDASMVIDILKGTSTSSTVKFIFDWLKQNYTVTSELISEGYCKGMTKHYIRK
jgi:hypothetical protein